MIKFIQRFPNCVTAGRPPQEYEFESIEELKTFIDNPTEECFINSWKTKFNRFEIVPYFKSKPDGNKLLIAHSKDGKLHLAIAFIREIEKEA